MDDFRGAIREDVQKGKSAVNEGLLYVYRGGIAQNKFSTEVTGHTPTHTQFVTSCQTTQIGPYSRHRSNMTPQHSVTGALPGPGVEAIFVDR